MSRKLSSLKSEIQRLRRAVDGPEKGTVDAFDDSMVGPVEDDAGNPIIDPVRLVAMGFSVV